MKIEQGWVRAVPLSVSDSVVYMTLVNSSEQTLRLTGASTPIAESAMLMITTRPELNGQEIVGMRMVDQLPARQMPDWLAAISRVNPLTLAVDASRDALLLGEFGSLGVTLMLLTAIGIVLLAAAWTTARGLRRES